MNDSYKDIGYQTLGWIQKNHAPTGKEQAMLAEIYNKAVAEGGYKKAAHDMLDILGTGSATDVWPWND